MKKTRTLTALLAATLLLGVGSVSANDTLLTTTSANSGVNSTLDLSAYSNLQLPLYGNSRVTSIEFNKTNPNLVTINGYAFIKDESFHRPDALWREIIFVNQADENIENAYRYQVSSEKKGQFLTNNTILNPGKLYNYDYAMYRLDIDLLHMKKYDNVTVEAIKPGTYDIYIRVSNGIDSNLLPIRNVTLSDGSNLQLTGGFYYDENGNIKLTVAGTPTTGNNSGTSSSNSGTTTKPSTGGNSGSSSTGNSGSGSGAGENYTGNGATGDTTPGTDIDGDGTVEEWEKNWTDKKPQGGTIDLGGDGKNECTSVWC